jgi:predicted negative regulator of RcsB-dependent stress response
MNTAIPIDYPAKLWQPHDIRQLHEDLRRKRDEHGAKNYAALNPKAEGDGPTPDPDYATSQVEQAMAQLYNDAMQVIAQLLNHNIEMQHALSQRVLAVIKENKDPPWVATHRHYKGTLYRLTGERKDARYDELENVMLYDDKEGNKFTLPKRQWYSHLEDGRPRYESIPSNVPGES